MDHNYSGRGVDTPIVVYYFFMYGCDSDRLEYETSRSNDRNTIFEPTITSFFVTIIQVEVVYLFMYECDVDHGYKKSRSNVVGDMFEQAVTRHLSRYNCSGQSSISYR